MAQNSLHRAVKIKLTRAEGPHADCGTIEIGPTYDDRFDPWRTANYVLMGWARTAPEVYEGYDKVDYLVTYDDGETYAGRYDMTAQDITHSNLAADIARHIEFMVSDTALVKLAGLPDIHKHRAYAQWFLDNYEIGREDREMEAAA